MAEESREPYDPGHVRGCVSESASTGTRRDSQSIQPQPSGANGDRRDVGSEAGTPGSVEAGTIVEPATSSSPYLKPCVGKTFLHLPALLAPCSRRDGGRVAPQSTFCHFRFMLEHIELVIFRVFAVDPRHTAVHLLSVGIYAIASHPCDGASMLILHPWCYLRLFADAQLRKRLF